MKQTRTIGTDVLLLMAKNLKDTGEITEEQYKEMEQRNNRLSNAARKDIVIKVFKWLINYLKKGL